MHRIPLIPGYRRELTWRFRSVLVLLLVLIAARLYLHRYLELQLGVMPLEAIWNPPPRHEIPDIVWLVESLNYCYVFLFLLWIRDGLVLSLDLVALRTRQAWRKRRQGSSRHRRHQRVVVKGEHAAARSRR